MKLKGIDILLVQELWCNRTSKIIEAAAHDLNLNAIFECRKRRGGGLGVVFNPHLKVRQLKYETKNCFEMQEIEIECNNETIKVNNLYRNPYSAKNRHTVNDFIEEYENFLSKEVVMVNNKSYHVGDYNIHWEKQDDYYTINFNKLLQRYNLIQNVTKPTHKN